MSRGPPVVRRAMWRTCASAKFEKQLSKGPRAHGTDHRFKASLICEHRRQEPERREIDGPIRPRPIRIAALCLRASSPCVASEEGEKAAMAAPAPQAQQHGEPTRLQKVMVAVDESECSRYALEWALRNLAATLAPPLLLLTVQPLVPVGYVSAASFGAPLGTVPVAPELIKTMQEQERQLTQALLDKAKAICAEHGIAVETFVEVGDAKEVVCEVAEKKNVDLLILGSHSRGPIERLFLGSVSNYCVHHCKCPVLVVKKQG